MRWVRIVGVACASIATSVTAAPADEGGHASLTTIAGVAEHYVARAHELMVQALSLVGIRYRYGGESPATGFDCSGFVRYVFNQLGAFLPRSAHEISRLGRDVDWHELRPGDLVFFNTLRRPFSHVGIYLGEQKFIHAPSRGGRIEIVSMTEPYWERRFNGARRVDL